MGLAGLVGLAGAAGLAGAGLAAGSPAAAPRPTTPRLTTPSSGGVAEANEGHLVVTWEPAGGAAGSGSGSDDAPPSGIRYQLQTAPEATLDGDFSEANVIDVGPALASLVSGLPDGDTRVRVRAVVDGTPGAWTEPGTIRVEYPEAGRVWMLMALGTVTLAALLAAIVIGARRARKAAS